jgi:hypothetical protein
MRKGIAAMVLALMMASAHAQTAVPFTFSAGAAARASEVNGNFQALVSAINGVDARVARLEGSIALSNASIAGTYRLFGLQNGLIAANGPGGIETITYTGTVTLAAGGTYTGTLNEAAHDLAFNGSAPSTLTTRPSSDPLSGTYSVSQNTKLTLDTFGGAAPFEFYGAAGGQILVGATSGEDPPPGQTAPMGTNVMLILVRTN